MASCEASVHTHRMSIQRLLSTVQCKALDWVLLVLYTGTIFFAIWGQPKYLARGLLVAMIVFIGIYLLPHIRSILGLDRKSEAWYREWAFPIGATVVMAALLLMFVLAAGVWQPQTHVTFVDKSISEMVVTKLPTIVFQQCLLQWHFMPLLLRVLKRRQHAFLLGAAIFSAFHLPNPLLMLLTFIAGWVWVYSYHANQRLTPLIISHLSLALIAANCCGEYVFNMRVGWGCINLFPKPVAASPLRYEWPGCAVGEIQLVSADPCNGRTCVHGWYVDAHYNSAPKEVLAEVDGQLIPLNFAELIEGIPEPIKELDPMIRSKYKFVVEIPASLHEAKRTWHLWMANRHGWLHQFPHYAGDVSEVCSHINSSRSGLIELSASSDFNGSRR